MLIKIGSLEIRTGKDAKGNTPIQTNRDDIPQLGYVQPAASGSNTVSTVLHRDIPPQAPSPKSGLALHQGKAHPMTKAIKWPDIPESPMDQTRLSILVNETDEWFRKHNCVNICVIRDYLNREGAVLYGDARIAYDTLHELHCKDFSILHPTILQSIPAMYSTVLQTLKGEFHVNDAWRV